MLEEVIFFFFAKNLNQKQNTFCFQFNLSQFLSTWEKSVPEGMKTSLCQLEVGA